MPIGIKDVFDTADMPTTYGSPIYSDHQPAADAAVVSTLRKAGAVVIGKTATTEFAFLHPAKTRNPWNLRHTPGGSSSGSAAAVAAGMTRLAIGTQTAGSTIRPAAFCGVFGFKPTHGSISLSGCLPLAPSLDTVGLFARTADDMGLLAHAASGGAIALPTSVMPSKPRIGLVSPSHWASCDQDTHQLFDRISALLGPASAFCSYVRPFDVDELTRLHRLILSVEVLRGFESLVAAHPDRVSSEFKAVLAEGRGFSDADYQAACRSAAEHRSRYGDWMKDFDFLILPSSSGEAPRVDAGTGDPDCARPGSLLGVPAISVPAALGHTGLPLGIQLLGRSDGDAGLVAWAGWLSALLTGPSAGMRPSRPE